MPRDANELLGSLMRFFKAEWVLLFYFLIALVTSCATYSGASTQTEPTWPAVFVQVAHRVVVTPVRPQVYCVVLKGVGPVTTYFAGHPLREIKDVPTATFAKLHLWKRLYFASRPLSAFLVFNAVGMDIRENSPVFAISHPNYNPQLQTMTYQAKMLHPGEVLQVGIFDEAALFIDSAL